jgi:hypothetical protein
MITRGEYDFVIVFCGQYMVVFLTQNLHSTDEDTGEVLISDRILKHPFTIR